MDIAIGMAFYLPVVVVATSSIAFGVHHGLTYFRRRWGLNGWALALPGLWIFIVCGLTWPIISIIMVIWWVRRRLRPMDRQTTVPEGSTSKMPRWAWQGGIVASILLVGVFAGCVVKWTFYGPQVRIVVQISYEKLLAGEIQPAETHASLGWAETQLLRAVDPADRPHVTVRVDPDQRLVQFDLLITHFDDTDIRSIHAGKFELMDETGAVYRPIHLAVDGVPVESVQHLEEDEPTEVTIVFQLPVESDPGELRYDAVDYFDFQPSYEEIIYVFQ
ncbi:MAG: hypothetical protein IIB19_02190 [Chloroflexi bacterium]|nr:hypothetical protein [Chloroflexota bacterium]